MRLVRNGLTVVECSVCIAIIAILLTLLLPTLVRARESARANQCEENLNQLGTGIAQWANRDEQLRYCSGAFDWKRDGCPDTYGWVADLVNMGVATPSKQRCPNNEGQVSQTFNDLLGYDTSSGVFAPNLPRQGLESQKNGADRFNAGLCVAISDLTSSADGWISSGRRSAYVRSFIDRGYATNYATSWFFSRSTMKIMVSGTNVVPMPNQMGAEGAYLGLRSTDIEDSLVPTSAIPFMGDASNGDVDYNILLDDIGDATKGVLYSKGQRLAESFTRGPHSWNNTGTLGGIQQLSKGGNRLLLGPTGALTGDIQPTKGEAGDNTKHGGGDALLWLQDTRGWSASHGSGTRRYVNILSMDGGVKQIYDENGDGLINPGFPVDTKLGVREQRMAHLGYADNLAEFGPAELYSLPFLKLEEVVKATCDDCD